MKTDATAEQRWIFPRPYTREYLNAVLMEFNGLPKILHHPRAPIKYMYIRIYTACGAGADDLSENTVKNVFFFFF